MRADAVVVVRGKGMGAHVALRHGCEHLPDVSFVQQLQLEA
jgi:hypothetical protein